MPKYDYRCTNTECAQTSTDDCTVEERDLPHVCGECGSDMRRLFNAPATPKMLSVGKRKHR